MKENKTRKSVMWYHSGKHSASPLFDCCGQNCVDCHLGKGRENTLVRQLVSTSFPVKVWMDCFGTECGASTHYHRYCSLQVWSFMSSVFFVGWQRTPCERLSFNQLQWVLSFLEMYNKESKYLVQPTWGEARTSRGKVEAILCVPWPWIGFLLSCRRGIRSVYDYYESKDETLWSPDARVKRYYAQV